MVSRTRDFQAVCPFLQSPAQTLIDSQCFVRVCPEPAHVLRPGILTGNSVHLSVAVSGLGFCLGHKVSPAVFTPGNPLPALLEVKGQLCKTEFKQVGQGVLLDLPLQVAFLSLR